MCVRAMSWHHSRPRGPDLLASAGCGCKSCTWRSSSRFAPSEAPAPTCPKGPSSTTKLRFRPRLPDLFRLQSRTGSLHLPSTERARTGEDGRGRSSWLVALHSSLWRPAFVSMAGASNPAVRIGLDKMFGQACA